MLLAIDVGNSNIVMGGYEGGALLFLARVATDRNMEADQYAVQLRGVLDLYHVQNRPITEVVLSCVVAALKPHMIEALRHFTSADVHIFSHADAGDVTVCIDSPTELGVDILATAIAVQKKYPLPAVIIDMGTATKITALNAEGQLLGVAIAPGLFVSQEALVGRASGLFGIALGAPTAAIGKNTQESMKSGVLLGSAAMLDGMIDRFAQEMGGLASVVATGGGAPLVVPHCRHAISVSETLLLDGLVHAAHRGKS